MARPRKFDPGIAIDIVMHAFWKQGYRNVSFDQLVERSGASRHGLYHEFGDKNGLLLSSLLHYERTVLHELTNELRKEDATLPEIRRFFHRIANVARNETNGAGCLMCNAHIEMETEAQIRHQTDAFFKRLRSLFKRCLDRARQKGELGPDKDVGALSDYLVGLVRGISANARSNPPAKAYEAYVDVALSVMT